MEQSKYQEELFRRENPKKGDKSFQKFRIQTGKQKKKKISLLYPNYILRKKEKSFRRLYVYMHIES